MSNPQEQTQTTHETTPERWLRLKAHIAQLTAELDAAADELRDTADESLLQRLQSGVSTSRTQMDGVHVTHRAVLASGTKRPDAGLVAAGLVAETLSIAPLGDVPTLLRAMLAHGMEPSRYLKIKPHWRCAKGAWEAVATLHRDLARTFTAALQRPAVGVPKGKPSGQPGLQVVAS